MFIHIDFSMISDWSHIFLILFEMLYEQTKLNRWRREKFEQTKENSNNERKQVRNRLLSDEKIFFFFWLEI
jgi:hypothetical protein